MRPGDHYNLHWPIRRGRFNIHNNVGGTLSAIMQDLEDLWSMAIEKYLDIPIKDLQVSTFGLYYYYLSDFIFSFVIFRKIEYLYYDAMLIFEYFISAYLIIRSLLK